jgi:hypothetical protein
MVDKSTSPSDKISDFSYEYITTNILNEILLVNFLFTI